MRGPDDIDPYEVLGLSPKADDVVVRAAWKALIRKYHPDASTAPDAAERAAKINAAFKLLVTPDARAAYDRSRSPVRPTMRPSAAPASTAVRRPSMPPVRRRRRRSIRRMAGVGLLVVLIGTSTFYLLRYTDAVALAAPIQQMVDGVTTNPSVARVRTNARRLIGLDAPSAMASPVRASAPAGPPPPVDPSAIAALVDRLATQDSFAMVAEARNCAAEATRAPDWAIADRCAAVGIAGMAKAQGLFGTADPGASYFADYGPPTPDIYASISIDDASIRARLDKIRTIVWAAMLKRLETRLRGPQPVPAPIQRQDSPISNDLR